MVCWTSHWRRAGECSTVPAWAGATASEPVRTAAVDRTPAALAMSFASWMQYKHGYTAHSRGHILQADVP
ncbi:hypothetical protein NicSoilC12_24430 [Arthrobacter sp. NicSoilC12]|nr:hypothetical protein NicSoilC12_24430 [Arthrobacter sp. NicSoilC12]